MTVHFPHKRVTRAEDAPIVIVGAGLGGLYTALKLAPLPVTVISPAPLGEQASSAWAQGGIAAAVGEGDTPEQHAADTIKTGAGLVDKGIAQLIASEAPERIADLLSYGVPFDKDLEGKLRLSREAAHSRRRIVRVKGDQAGKAIMASLIAVARATPSITFMEGYTVKDLAYRDGRVYGVYLWRSDEIAPSQGDLLPARAVVFASGGVGGLFQVTTNPSGNRGDAIAMAARAGAVIADPEFVQFHPTAFNIGADPAPLATEALRGDGAILINGDGHRFMEDLHEAAELGPRDIVARAVHEEVVSGRGAYLDCREAIGERIYEAFPTVTETCRAYGIDPAHEPIPVAPAAHYHMGGIATDDKGRSTVKGLWACGEAASTGAHGANRLASNSLLEALVFGARIADDIRHCEFPSGPLPVFAAKSAYFTSAADGETTARLRKLMAANLGVVRNEEGLIRTLAILDAQNEGAGLDINLRNMLTAARFIAYGALLREESRGSHYRSDHPEPRAKFAKRTLLSLQDLDRESRHIVPVKDWLLAEGTSVASL